MDGRSSVPGLSNAAGRPAVDRWLSALPVREPLLAVYALWAAVALFYWPSSKALVGFWSDALDKAGTHGFLVLLVALGLVMRARARLAAEPIRPSLRGFCVLLILSAAWLWFYRAAIQDLHLLLLPMLLLAAIVGVLGWPTARVMIFPVAFLYFAMPVWSLVITPLQTLSIDVNSVLIWLTGVPAYIAGNVVNVPAGSLEIAGGCSGRHSFVVGLTLAALYGELARDSLRWRLAWIALMGALALVANWVRIFVIIVAAEATDMQTFLVTVDHYWFGWGIFVLAFIGFLWIAGRLRDAAKISPARQGSVTGEPSHADPPAGVPRVSGAILLTMLFCLAALPAAAYATASLRVVSGAIHIDWPAAPPGWRGPAPVTATVWQPLFLNASVLSQQQYVDLLGQPVEVFVVAYRVQRQGAKLLGYDNSLFEKGDRLRSIEERITDSAVGPWRQDTVVDAGGQRSIIWSRYHIGAHTFVRPWAAQLWYGVAAVVTPVVSSLTALRALCRADCTAAHEQLVGVTAQLQPLLRVDALPIEHMGSPDGQGKSR